MSYDIEIGRSKRARRTFSLDEIALVPSRRTRDPQDVSTSWQIDAYNFDIPVVGAPMDSVMSPATAIALGRCGGLGVLDLEGLWARYEDPQPVLDEIADLSSENLPQATRRMQELYSAPIQPELIKARLAEIREQQRRAERRRTAVITGSLPTMASNRPPGLSWPSSACGTSATEPDSRMAS